MKEILRTNDLTVIAFATALLNDADIECIVLDVHMSAMEGSIGAFPRRMVVHPDRAFMARAILRDNDIDVVD